MAEVIETFGALDKELLGTLDSGTSADLVLDNIEARSLRAWLRNVLIALPDDAIKDLEIKNSLVIF